ncbi:MAG: helix-turn-helix domain-containing protein [Dissulfurispiraceae bacterium]|jgi:hypothetical protein
MSKLFKTTREDIGSSLREVAKHTRIKESCLVAIEEEDYDKLPVEVYTRGYIKEYAKYLKLPTDAGIEPYEKYLEINKKYNDKLAKTSKEAAELQSRRDTLKVQRQEGNEIIRKIREKPETLTSDKLVIAPKEGSEEFQERKKKEESCQEAKIPPPPSKAGNKMEAVKIYGNKFLWKSILLLIVVLSVVYQFISSRNDEKASQVVSMSPQVQQPKEVLPDAVTPPSAPALTVPEETKTTEIVPEKKRHQLVISAEDTSWVQVIMDGTEKKEALLKRGESLTAEAYKTINVLVGNAGGVSMKFDGKDLPAGKAGEVLKLTLPEKPKIGNPVQNIESSTPQKPSGFVNPENTIPGQLSNDKTMPDRMPEQPALTSKP